MLYSRSTITMLLSAALLVPTAFASSPHPAHKASKAKATSSHASKTKATSSHESKTSAAKNHKGKRKSVQRIRGQQKIASERATQIQQALIREHYLSGEPSGTWDSASIMAMQKFQADQRWQTKLMPDSLSDATAQQVGRAESPTSALALLLVSPDFLRR